MRCNTNTYAYAGGEIDLIRRGVIPAGSLSPQKARLLLSLCLMTHGPAAADAVRRRVALLV